MGFLGDIFAILPIDFFAFSVLPLLDSNQMVFTLPISPYEVYLFEVIGVSEGQSEKPYLLFWGKITKMFFCFSCLLIGIPWLPLRAILYALWPSTHWWLFWIGLRIFLDFHILVCTFCKTIHFFQQKKEAFYQIWSVGNAIPVYLCNIDAKDQGNHCELIGGISNFLLLAWRNKFKNGDIENLCLVSTLRSL